MALDRLNDFESFAVVLNVDEVVTFEAPEELAGVALSMTLMGPLRSDS